jgi:hypothetical protein
VTQTKRKRKGKHRGNAAGVVEARGRTGRPPSAEEKKKISRELAREERLSREPTWRSSFNRAAMAAALMFVVLTLTGKGSGRFIAAAVFSVLALALYVPGGYYLERFLWKRRMRTKGAPR